MTDALFWERLHGGATHFPLVLVLVSAVFDAAALLRSSRSNASDLHAAGRWLLVVGALGAIGAVISGLELSRWEVGGTGTLLRHHLFVWPAFALIVGLAVWRMIIREESSRRGFAIYLLGMGAACALVTAAGFFGGELILGK